LQRYAFSFNANPFAVEKRVNQLLPVVLQALGGGYRATARVAPTIIV
jgi:hypothetical protein